jgi:hypothetical protein
VLRFELSLRQTASALIHTAALGSRSDRISPSSLLSECALHHCTLRVDDKEFT